MNRQTRKKKTRIPRHIALILMAIVLMAGGFAVFCRLHVDQARARGVYPIQNMDNIPQADYIIVPGCAINSGVFSYHLQDRMDSAIMLYKAGRAGKILLSGGYSQSSKAFEADLMRGYAIEKGVEPDAIIVDNAGLDTYDTLCRAKEYFGDQTALICTQDQFAARTLYLAAATGLSCTLVGSDIQEYGPNIFGDIREFLAAAKAFLDVQSGSGPDKSVAQFPYEMK